MNASLNIQPLYLMYDENNDDSDDNDGTETDEDDYGCNWNMSDPTIDYECL